MPSAWECGGSMGRRRQQADHVTFGSVELLGFMLVTAIAVFVGWQISQRVGVDLGFAPRVMGSLGIVESGRPPHVQSGAVDVAGATASSGSQAASLGVPTPPYCRPGETPRYQFGFADLKARLGSTMGDPVECEHANSANGDTLQKTSTGLAFYRMATNTATFTNGVDHWALTARGLVQWQGDSPDPPAR